MICPVCHKEIVEKQPIQKDWVLLYGWACPDCNIIIQKTIFLDKGVK